MAKATKRAPKLKSLKPEIDLLEKKIIIEPTHFSNASGGFCYPEKKTYTPWGVIFNWLAFLTVGAAVYFGCRYIDFSIPTLKGWQAVLFGVSIAFVWVEQLRWLSLTKPFNCLPCMSGWATLIVAYFFNVEAWYLYLPAGVLAGAVFSSIKMRWL